jgi:S-adenosylmethionine decarboxylase proenzyme
LDNVGVIQALMERAARSANMTIVASMFQPFIPQGVSGVVVVEESHLSIHTWPEHGYAAVDCYTCGDGDPQEAHRVLMTGLQAQRCEQMFVQRGNLSGERLMAVLPGDEVRTRPSDIVELRPRRRSRAKPRTMKTLDA